MKFHFLIECKGVHTSYLNEGQSCTDKDYWKSIIITQMVIIVFFVWAGIKHEENTKENLFYDSLKFIQIMVYDWSL